MTQLANNLKHQDDDSSTLYTKLKGLFFLFLIAFTGFAGFFLIANRATQLRKSNDNASDLILDMDVNLLNNKNNICEMPKAKKLCEGNIGIMRDQMPQVRGEVRSKYYNHKKEQGFNLEERIVPVEKLIPTQSEMSAKKILKLLKNPEVNPCDSLVTTAVHSSTEKMSIIDGHHHAMACRLRGGNQRVMAIADKPHHILEELHEFNGVTRESLSPS